MAQERSAAENWVQMSNEHLGSDSTAAGGRPDRMTALFSAMVLQQTQTALMLLGQVPHPDTGQTVVDLEAAQVLIDQLEMLEVKTRGNLSKDEEALLKQSLMTARMAFVQAVEHPPAAPSAPPQPQAAPTAGSAAGSAPAAQPQAQAQPTEPKTQPDQAPPEPESRRKFFKKY